jgi:hypothetical protein
METAGNNNDASRQPDGVQGTTKDREYAVRALTHIHAARAAIDAAEDHLNNRNPHRAPAYRIASAIDLAVAEWNCWQGSQILSEGCGYRIHSAPPRSSYRLDPDAPRPAVYRDEGESEALHGGEPVR